MAINTENGKNDDLSVLDLLRELEKNSHWADMSDDTDVPAEKSMVDTSLNLVSVDNSEEEVADDNEEMESLPELFHLVSSHESVADDDDDVDSLSDTHLIIPEDSEYDEEDIGELMRKRKGSPSPDNQQNPISTFLSLVFSDRISIRDFFEERMRKRLLWIVLVISTALFLTSFIWIWLSNMTNASRYNRIAQDFSQNSSMQGKCSVDGKVIRENFSALYGINPDVRGFLTFRSSDSEQFLDIQYPVVLASPSNAYDKKDFFGKRNRNGCLHFDGVAGGDPYYEDNAVTVIYGNQSSDGQMMAKLNSLVSSQYHARSAAFFTLDMLDEKQEYQVFAVMIVDETATGARGFDYAQKSFATADEFKGYVKQAKARSVFNYPVEVKPGDDIAVLSTPADYSLIQMKNCSVVVMGKRLTAFSAPADTKKIVINKEAVMPFDYYRRKGAYVPSLYAEAVDALMDKTTTLPKLTSTTTTATVTTSSSSSVGSTTAKTTASSSTASKTETTASSLTTATDTTTTVSAEISTTTGSETTTTTTQ